MRSVSRSASRKFMLAAAAALTVAAVISLTGSYSSDAAQASGGESDFDAKISRLPDGRSQTDQDVDASLSEIQQRLASFGYGDQIASSISYAENLVTIYVPAEIRPDLEADLEGLDGPLRVAFETPGFPIDALTTEGERLSALPGVAYAGPNENYSGMEVGIIGESNSRRLLNFDSPFPLETVPAEAPVPAYGRNNSGTDTSVMGGSLIAHVNTGTSCSVGILVVANGVSAITTAAHCPAGQWRKGSNTTVVGSTNSLVSQAKDIRVIELAAGYWTQALIAEGGWNTLSSLDVYRAAGAPTDGQRICTNGAMTGTRCGENYVRGINKSITSDGFTRSPGFWILSNNIVNGGQECNGMRGDSGSPVFTRLSNSYNAEVFGFTIAIDPSFSTAECYDTNPNYPISVDNKPSARTFAINAGQALAAVNATPRLRP